MSPRLTALALVAFLFAPLGVHALGQPTSLSVSPSTLQLTADQSVALVVTAKDATNATEDVTGASTYSVTDPRGRIVGTTYEAGKAGSWLITVTYEGLTATVPVTITAGALTEMVINPNSEPEIVPLDRTTDFSAQGFDADNNRITIPSPTWSVTGGIGTISTRGVFTPTKLGTGTVVITSGAITASVRVDTVAARGTNENVNATTNTNTVVNTNTTNTNGNVNGDTNAPAPTNVNTPTEGSTDDATTCTSRKNWLWGIILLALLGAVAVLYAFVPVTKNWPAFVAIVAALTMSVVERNTGCTDNVWWPWIAILGTIGLTIFAYQQTPKQPSA